MPGEACLLRNTSRNQAACEEKQRFGGGSDGGNGTQIQEHTQVLATARRARLNSPRSPTRALPLFPLVYLMFESNHCPAYKIVPDRLGRKKKKNIVTSGHEKHVTHRLSPICNLIACSVGNNECRPPLATCHLLDTTRVVCPPPPSPHLVSDTLALTTFFFFSTAATGGFHSQSALPASSGQGRNRGQRASGVAVRVRDRQQARDPWKKNKQHTGWGGVGSGRGGRVKTNDLRLTQQPADELRRQ